MITRSGRYDDRIDALEKEYPGYAKQWTILENILLSHGGTDVACMPLEDRWFVPYVAAGGDYEAQAGIPVIFKLGEPCSCHVNTAHLMLSGEIDAIVTGYGLSNDGLWRPHSWGLDHINRIIETTEERDMYIGRRLNFMESVLFILEENLVDEFTQAVHTINR